jgi:NAD-dependent SIR2 family protein deacetylase
MRCDHCKHEFDTVALKAKQGTQTICPSCGEMTTVRYSFTDSLKDFHGLLVRDPKYASMPMSLLFYVVFGAFALALIVFFIRSH